MSGRLAHADVVKAVDGLMAVDPWIGLRLTVINVVGLNLLLLLTFTVEGVVPFVALSLLTGLFYGSVMMTSHDAIHHTLTGWYWFDEIAPRMLSYFVFWPHGLYSELHKLHHKLNGRDLTDPENPTTTAEAYAAARGVRRFAMRHRLWLACFVYGGFGMIVRHVFEGMRWYRKHEGVRRAMWIDAAGILCAGTITVSVIVYAGVTWRYAFYLFLVERMIGFSHQLRSHLEHYGLWGRAGDTLLEARLHSCRNIRTHRLVSRFFNGLNYHSVHHAFPRIPFYHLQAAHERIAALCGKAGRPLPEEGGYWRTLWRLVHAPMVLEPATATELDATRKSLHVG